MPRASQASRKLRPSLQRATRAPPCFSRSVVVISLLSTDGADGRFGWMDVQFVGRTDVQANGGRKFATRWVDGRMVPVAVGPRELKASRLRGPAGAILGG